MRGAAAVLALVLAAAPAAEGQTPPLPPPPDAVAESCAGEAFRQFDFWLGRWSVGPPGQAPGGRNEIVRLAQGCALLERYHNAAGYSGSSLNWYDPSRGTWTQQWIDSSGVILHLSGGLDAEGRMVLAGAERETPQGPVRDRITWIPRADGVVEQVWDVSGDGGATWRNVFTGEYRRLPE